MEDPDYDDDYSAHDGDDYDEGYDEGYDADRGEGSSLLQRLSDLLASTPAKIAVGAIALLILVMDRAAHRTVCDARARSGYRASNRCSPDGTDACCRSVVPIGNAFGFPGRRAASDTGAFFHRVRSRRAAGRDRAVNAKYTNAVPDGCFLRVCR